MKGHWAQEDYEEPNGIRGKKVFGQLTYVDFRPLGLIGDEEKSYSPFVSTLRPPDKDRPEYASLSASQ